MIVINKTDYVSFEVSGGGGTKQIVTGEVVNMVDSGACGKYAHVRCDVTKVVWQVPIPRLHTLKKRSGNGG